MERTREYRRLAILPPNKRSCKYKNYVVCNIRLKEGHSEPVSRFRKPAQRKTVELCMSKRTDVVWGCNRDNLSPPVLAKNKGTAVFRLVPLQGEVSGSVSQIQPHTASKRTMQRIQIPLHNPSCSFL